MWVDPCVLPDFYWEESKEKHLTNPRHYTPKKSYYLGHFLQALDLLHLAEGKIKKI